MLMELRELVRHTAMLVRMGTKIKNKIHGIIFVKGINNNNSIIIASSSSSTNSYPTNRYNEKFQQVIIS
jgi:hypothetical protein